MLYVCEYAVIAGHIIEASMNKSHVFTKSTSFQIQTVAIHVNMHLVIIFSIPPRINLILQPVQLMHNNLHNAKISFRLLLARNQITEE